MIPASFIRFLATTCPTLPISLLGFTSLSYLLFSILAHFLKTRSSNSDPPSYPLLGCLIPFYQNRHRLIDWYTDLLTSSPSLTIVVERFGARRTIITANPSNVEHVLRTGFHNFLKGKPFTEILDDLLGCGIFNADGDLWSFQRKLVSHEFSSRSLREFVVRALKEEVDSRLIPVLETTEDRGEMIDLQELLRRFAFDIVCKVSLGTDPVCLDLSRPVPQIVKAFDTASEISAMRGSAPLFFIWKMKRMLNMGSEKSLLESVEVVRNSVSDIIQQRKEYRSGGDDLLSKLLSAGQNDEVVRDMIISFIMAGRDTTSSAMTWLFWLLSKWPDTEAQLTEEVNRVVRDGERELEFEALKELDFVKACLCESMWLYPPVAWDSKYAENDDVFPDGTLVRKGDRVTYFPYGMGRMEELWGKDRLEFKPDRWFEPKLGLKMVDPFRFPVFQAGPRVCLGKEMAFIQMKYVVATIVRRYEITSESEDQPAFIPLLTAHMAGGFKVLIKKK